MLEDLVVMGSQWIIRMAMETQMTCKTRALFSIYWLHSFVGFCLGSLYHRYNLVLFCTI